MKLLAVLLSFLMTFNVMAASGTAQELERALDDYQYALTVEWDQKDQVVYEAETKAFFEKIGSLIAEQGASKDEILAMAEKKMANKQAFEALKLRLSLLSEVKSSEELAKILKENAKEFYGHGASWAPDGTVILSVVAVVAIVGYLIWFNANYKCVATDQRWECDTTSTTSSSHTSCGWETYCTDYAKK